MKIYYYLILSFLIATNTYALDCSQVSVQLLNIPLKPKIEKLEGFKVTNYGGRNIQSIISFWKQQNNIQHNIKIYYQNNNAFMVIATYRGYSKNDATNKLDEIIKKVGRSNVKLKIGEANPFYHIKCNKGVSSSLFINELHGNKSISYIVNISIVNDVIYNNLTQRR